MDCSTLRFWPIVFYSQRIDKVFLSHRYLHTLIWKMPLYAVLQHDIYYYASYPKGLAELSKDFCMQLLSQNIHSRTYIYCTQLPTLWTSNHKSNDVCLPCPSNGNNCTTIAELNTNMQAAYLLYHSYIVVTLSVYLLVWFCWYIWS